MCAAVTQVLTGFGFALVAIPLLMYVFPGYEAVLICLVLSSCLLSLQAWNFWKLARWDLIWKLTVVGFVGILTGVAVSDMLDAVHLKSIVGGAVLIYVIIQWVQIERERRSRLVNMSSIEMAAANNCQLEQSEKDTQKKERLPKGFYVAGLTSGLLIGVVGMPGPPIVAVLVHYLKKDSFRATLVYYFLINFIILLTLAFSIFYRESTSTVLITAASLLIPMLIGYAIGQPISKYIKEDNFKRIVFSLLIIVGVTSIWQALVSL